MDGSSLIIRWKYDDLPLCLHAVHLAESDTHLQEEWKAAEELRITGGVNFKETLVVQPTEGDGDKVRKCNCRALTYDDV